MTATQDVHELFLANFFAQTAALAFGKTADEVRAEGTAEEIVPARVFSGNRPTTSIMAPALTPSVVGQLIALYEHITFTQGIVWGIDSFDQWGVELGKQLALKVTPAVGGDEAALAEQDPSTQGSDPLLPNPAWLSPDSDERSEEPVASGREAERPVLSGLRSAQTTLLRLRAPREVRTNRRAAEQRVTTSRVPGLGTAACRPRTWRRADRRASSRCARRPG